MAKADRAAAWLSALEAELWHLASDEREAVLAELRGHLAARAEAGALGLAPVATIVAALAVGRAAGALAHGLAATDAIRRGAGLAMLALGSIALLRVQPWLAALAARREGFGPAAAWRGTKGRM